MKGSIKSTSLKREHTDALEVGDSISIESTGAIVNDENNWEDICESLRLVFGDNVVYLWNNSFTKCFNIEFEDKVFEIWHGNTKWFTLTRRK